MSVYAIADLHGQLPQWPEDCDLLLLAGDICPDFRPMNHYDWVDKKGHQQALWLDTVFRGWLDDRPADCEIVAIWGNHDWVGQHAALIPELPWRLLQDSETSVNSIRIFGTPWVPGLPSWAFYANDIALEARSELIPEGLDILMSHGPPMGCLDFIPGGTEKQASKYGNINGMHVGDVALKDAIRTKRPLQVICGHIHESRGAEILFNSRVFNVAAVDDFYVMRTHPFVRLGC